MHISQKMTKVWPARNKMNFLDLAQKLISISNPHQHFDVSRDGIFHQQSLVGNFSPIIRGFIFYPTRWEFFPWHTKNRVVTFLPQNFWKPHGMMALRWDLLRRLLFPDLAWLGLTSSLLCVYNARDAQGGKPQERCRGRRRRWVGFVVEIELLVFVGLVGLGWIFPVEIYN